MQASAEQNERRCAGRRDMREVSEGEQREGREGETYLGGEDAPHPLL